MMRELEQDQVEREGIERLRGCNSHSMNFELSSGLQETLDTWCLSPRSEELEGGLIIRRDQAGGYELEPVINPLSLSNIDPFLFFGDAGLDVANGPRRRQPRTLDMIHEHQAADAEMWQGGAIFKDPLPQDNHSLGHSIEQSMDFYNDVVWRNQKLRPSIERDHRASNTNIYHGEAIFEDPSPPDNLSIEYHEKWSMDMNDRIVVRQLGSECIRAQSRGSDIDIPFHETALNVYSPSPFLSATKTYQAALSDMLQPSPDNSSLHLLEEQGMDIYNDVVWKRRTSPWVKQEHRSSNMEIYFDETVPEAYEYPSNPLKPDLQPNKASLSYILQSPPAEDINDRSPPSSPTKYRYTSPEKNIDHHSGPLYFDEAMPEAYTPSPVVPSIEMHMASVSHILKSPPAEEISDRSPPLSPIKPKDISPDENVDNGGFSPGPFRVPPSDSYARGLAESRSLVRELIETTSSTAQATKRKPGRPLGSHNKKNKLSTAQSKKIATTALKRIETLRKRSTQAELLMTADSQEGNARKRRRKNRAKYKSDHDSEDQLKRGSGEFERRLNLIGRIKADNGRKDMEHRGEDQENQENWERITYDPGL